MTDFLIVIGAGLVAALITMGVTALISRQVGRVAIVDVAWGLGFIAVALTSAVVGVLLDEGDSGRRWLVFALVAVWGARLSWHIRRKNHGTGEDPRYAKMLGDASFAAAVRKVFGTQALVLWFVALPVQVSAAAGDGVMWVLFIGVALWLVGVIFESVGDAQLAAYKKDPDRGTVMDRGLWRYTRHPNYFGDACVWWGIWLVAASAWPGVLTVLSPIAMTYFLVFASGARLLEKTMMKRDGYPEYAARTSMFIPLPPRSG